MRYQGPDNGVSALRLRLLPVAVLVLFAFRTASAAEPAAIDRVFIQDYCTSCHSGASKRGGLDLTSLTSPVTVQVKLADDSLCWSAQYSFPLAIKNDAVQFKDKAD